MKTVIYGNGAIARLLYSYMRRTREIAGFTVDRACIEEGAARFCDLPLAAFDEVEKVFPPEQHDMIIAMGFIDMNALRAEKFLAARAKGYASTSYVHESVILHDGVVIDENCIVLDHVSIHPGCRIGAGTFISSNVNIGHDCVVGASNWINSGVAVGGGCVIEEACFFGVNASVAHGLRIGARTFVAANTLINRPTQPDQVYLSEAGQLFKLKSQAFLKFSGIFE